MAEPTDWPTDATRYELVGKIGQGAFASVWRASMKENAAQECAIKVLNLDHVDSNLSEIRLEVQSMRLSSHPNILPCHAAFVKSTDLWLVTQLMRKGSSLHCLKVARRRARDIGQPIPKMEDHILYILHETLKGLQYIHDNGQIHRDIKAGNILIDSDGRVCIADFGVSGWLVNAGTQQEKAQTFVGTPCWMGPEVMEQVNGYDYKADIWSLGITALELAKGYAPYARYPPMKVLIRTIQEDPPSLDTYEEEDGMEDEFEQVEEDFSSNFRKFVDRCLQKNPAKRPKAQELLTSKHLEAFHNEAHRNRRRLALVEQVCELVEDVGSASSIAEQIGRNSKVGTTPGHTPVSIIMSTRENDRPAGTTWVFADGSQVLASTQTTHASIDDVIEELDQFGLQTGGENYIKVGRTTPPTSSPTSGNAEDEPDDLNAFMDEFELNTQGENFQRTTKS
jgi:serine/threonine-protein kinase OSR1/STK39